MADTQAMLRIIEHAATRLAQECDQLINAGSSQRSTIAATSYGAAVLRMVAACMATEDEPQRPAQQRDGHGRFIGGQSHG